MTLTPELRAAARREGGCICWVEVALHDGHCCFEDPEHFALPDPLPPMPCGHEPSELHEARVFGGAA